MVTITGPADHRREAEVVDLSKSGLYAHFGSKQELQLATVEEAGRILAEEVVRPATGMAPTVIFREVGIGP
jgi:AcrR family transcriptional regulator